MPPVLSHPGNPLYHLIPSMLGLGGVMGFLRLLETALGLLVASLEGGEEAKSRGSMASPAASLWVKDFVTGGYCAGWNAIMSGWNPMM